MIKGWVGNGESAAAENCCILRNFERESCRNWIGDLRRNCASYGVIESEDGVFHYSVH